MFQYAALMGIARKRGYAFGINFDIKPCGKYSFLDILELPLIFSGLTAENVQQVFPTVHERTYRFDPDFFSIPDNVNLIGNFESEKYFAHVRDDVRREFTFRQEILEHAKAFVTQLPRKPVVCVHVRRGDFVQLQHNHTVLTMETYYDRALSLFGSQDFTLLLFSDQFELARPMFARYTNVISCDRNHAVSLAVMSLCKYHVIANSTFAWWGAWLNPATDKIVVAPRDWLGPQRRHLGADDVYCDGWIVV
jgi:hypothetical protein